MLMAKKLPIWCHIAVLTVYLGLVPATARAEEELRNVETTCNHGKVYDAGLCYDRCRPGYDGVGPRQRQL